MDKTAILQSAEKWLSIKNQIKELETALKSESDKITSYCRQHKINEIGGVKLIKREGAWYIPTETLRDKYSEIWNSEKVQKSASEYITKK